MKVAAVQMTSGREVKRNLAEAGRLIEQAAGEGANLVVLPENFSFLGATDAERLAAAEEPGSGPAQDFLAEAARANGVWLVGGTVPIRNETGGRNERACSRSILFAPDGCRAASYDKIHLFDVAIPGRESESYRESATTTPGREVVAVETPLGRIGMAVCYDLRFPALFHRLGVLGMDILVLPAAFTVPTGQAHWRLLLTARAVESLVYVVAAGQWGEHAGGRKTYGHSLIVGPWGEVLAEREDDPGVVSAEIDMIELERIRSKFPVLQHRRELT
ncbi:MAG TPA: carbon-nitrogen hydrolase family protein [Gammaproteobacteria bacterium]|nr:carbon-nitrogen hydrolase family protein [Gammaproteobacteria bacterium]